MAADEPSTADTMAAFDRLPRELRDELNRGPFRLRPTDIDAALRAGVNVGTALHMIRKTWPVYTRNEARRWRKAHPTEFPHVAANATLMFTEPLPERETPQQRQRIYRHRQLKRARAPALWRTEMIAKRAPVEPKANPPPVICL